MRIHVEIKVELRNDNVDSCDYFNYSDSYAMPPGMDPSFLFRSPMFSDAENNNLMAAAAAAEKARAMMLMGARPPGPPGPLGPPPPPLGLFPNAALAALAASSPTSANPASRVPITTSAGSNPSLPQLYTLGSNRENPLGLSPALFNISHWNALHQAALASAATSNGLQMASSSSSPESPKPSSSPITTSVLPMSPLLTSVTSSTGVASRPLFPGLPPTMRFTPYVVPPKRSTSPSISNPEERSSPVSEKMRPESTSPSRSSS